MSAHVTRHRAVSFYHRQTGLLNGHHLLVSNDRAIELNVPPDHIAIDGHHDSLSKKVDLATGEVVDYQPPQPSADHEWNATTKRWVLNAAAVERHNAAQAAQARFVELEKQERTLLRRLVLNPNDTEARAALQAIDDEISRL